MPAPFHGVKGLRAGFRLERGFLFFRLPAACSPLAASAPTWDRPPRISASSTSTPTLLRGAVIVGLLRPLSLFLCLSLSRRLCFSLPRRCLSPALSPSPRLWPSDSLAFSLRLPCGLAAPPSSRLAAFLSPTPFSSPSPDPRAPPFAVYQAWMGYYKNYLKQMRWDVDQLVDEGNQFASKAFISSEVSGIPKNTIGKMGLKGVGAECGCQL